MSGTSCCRRQDLLGEASPCSRQYLAAISHKQNEQQARAPSLVRSRLLWSAEEETTSRSLLPEEGCAQGPWDATQAAGHWVFAVYRLYVPHHMIKVRKLMKPSLNNLRKPLHQTLILTGDYNCPDICWKGNMAGHKWLRRFLEGVRDNLLI